METEIAELGTREIAMQLMSLSERAMLITVTNDVELLAADMVKTACLEMRKTVVAFFAPLKEAAHKAHKAITNAESLELSKIVPGENHVKTAMNDYQMEQKRIRGIEEARLLKLAREREESERLELAAAIEREAAWLEASGQVEDAAITRKEAETVLATPAYIPPPRMAAPVKTKNNLRMIVNTVRLQSICDDLDIVHNAIAPTIPGVRFWQRWEFEVYNSASVPDAYRRPS